MENKILESAKINFLVESQVYRNAELKNIKEIYLLVESTLKEYNGVSEELAMISIRNEEFIKNALDESNSCKIKDYLNTYNKNHYVDCAEACRFSELVENMTEKSVDVEDLFEDINILNGKLYFKNINSQLIEDFVSTFERSRDICELCLEDSTVYNAESLRTYLPKLLLITEW